MGKALRRLAARICVTAAVIVAAYGGWKWGDGLFPRVESRLGIGTGSAAADEVTPELAGATMRKIEAFRDSGEGELRLGSVEVSSVLRYTMPGMLPDGVVNAQVAFDEDRLQIEATVLPARMEIPEIAGWVGIAGMFPDTVPVSVSASLTRFGERRSILLIQGILVQGVALPETAFPEILEALGRAEVSGLPASAILVPEVAGLGTAFIRDGTLVLVRA